MTPTPPPVDVRFVQTDTCRSTLTITNITSGTVRLSGGTSDSAPPAQLEPGQTIRYRIITPIGELVVWHIVAEPANSPVFEQSGIWNPAPCIGTPTTIARRDEPLRRFALTHLRWWL